MDSKSNTRLVLLDGIRGLAAFSVLFWHWQHFFYVNNALVSYKVEDQPFFAEFFLFYQHGDRAVPLFFALSGIVFFWKFEQKIVHSNISLLQFSIGRFSRLYPLHIITLLFVIILQWIYSREGKGFFVYPFNDFYHAILNIFLVNAWGFEKGWSFNAPSWSISVDVFLYLTFMIGCTLRRWRYGAFLICVAIGCIAPEKFQKVSTGLVQFYVAGLLFAAYRCAPRKMIGWAICALSILAVLCWIVIYKSALMGHYLLDYLTFPLSMCALAAVNFRFQIKSKVLIWLGDISYSIYLWHFPIQICVAFIVDRLGYPRGVLSNPLLFMAFLGTVTFVGHVSHYRFEQPVQFFIRKRIFAPH